MTIPNLVKGASEKGLDILGTGDATQPDWLGHLRRNLIASGEELKQDNVSFILTVEIEDKESIHHIVILPDFQSVDELRRSLRPSSANIDGEWGGRPRVNLAAEDLAAVVRETGGLIGPAHAFTPFKSIFREGRYESLLACYKKEAANIHFLELGLSADTEIADCIPELDRITFVTSSDAHSPSPDKLGREFVRFSMESATFDELRNAILRREGRKPVLNLGLDPRLGKYYLSFCSSCRRTVELLEGDGPPRFDQLNIYMECKNPGEKAALLRDIHKRRVKCPVDGKNLRLGVRDRAMMIGTGKSISPQHRPLYLHVAPLLDVISASMNGMAKSTKTVRSLYDRMRNSIGRETAILSDAPIDMISQIDKKVGAMVEALRNGTATYAAGGGGRYGRLVPPWESGEAAN
jgi:PHP family Zn ribbon phosphoesterase